MAAAPQPRHVRVVPTVRERAPLELATRVYAVIGGVVGYATDIGGPRPAGNARGLRPLGLGARAFARRDAASGGHDPARRGSDDSRVRGPVFEEQARAWARRHASAETLGGHADHVGPTAVVVDKVERQIDVVVATADDPAVPPSERTILALGEAKAGETLDIPHLRELEKARAALGTRAAHARLLLARIRLTPALRAEVAKRSDVELVDLERLYAGE